MTDCDGKDAPLVMRLFGPFQVCVHGRPLPRLRSRKGYWLLALLALRHGRDVERAWLAGTLWPDSAEPRAFTSLRESLKDLRHALGPEAGRVCSPTARTVRLDLAGALCDLATFDAAIAQGDLPALREAVARYGGPLLEGWTEEWLLQERRSREQAYLAALERLAGDAAARGEHSEAARYLQLAAAADPLHEGTQRALMQALAADGNYAAASQTYRDLRLLLHRELNAEPAPQTRALFERLRAEARRQASSRSEGWKVGRFESSKVEADPKAFQLSNLPTFKPSNQELAPEPSHLPPASGVVSLDSPFYVVRPADEELRAAIDRADSIVRIQGPHQVGKTSLLARGLQHAREAGTRVLLTDFEVLDEADLASAERFFLALAAWIAEELGLDVLPSRVWRPHLGSSVNFERFLRREVLASMAQPFVWGMDDVDRLFPYDCASAVFGLFRSWHNRRGLEPAGPWSGLTMVMAYATEAHLFISDMNQSPFNVGTRLALTDFTPEQVADLNRRYGSPLCDEARVTRYHALVSGHPYLVTRGLWEMAAHDLDLDEWAAQADGDSGSFGDHLRRLLTLLLRDAGLCDALRAILRGEPCPSGPSFYRLFAAGVIAGTSGEDARPRCPVYARYLARHLL